MRQSGVETPVKVGLKLCADGALVAIYAVVAELRAMKLKEAAKKVEDGIENTAKV